MMNMNTKANAIEVHPPCGTFMNDDDRYAPSIDPKNRRNNKASRIFFCHTKMMINAISHVVINITVMHARPKIMQRKGAKVSPGI
jgi:hypothetical protein